MRARQEQITFEASGDGLRERGAAGVVDGSVVEWEEDGSNVHPGPNASKYESVRKGCGAHILPNAFWKIPNFDVQQMLRIRPWRSKSTIIAILLKYFFCAEEDMDMEGLAASRMEA
jgi:hypothetical protein